MKNPKMMVLHTHNPKLSIWSRLMDKSRKNFYLLFENAEDRTEWHDKLLDVVNLEAEQEGTGERRKQAKNTKEHL